MESPSDDAPAGGIYRVMEQACQPATGCLTLEKFIEIALYDPQFGYYRQSGRRVGRDPGADFYTASSMGGTFARLLAAGITRLLGPTAAEYAFVEVGPESDAGIMGYLDSLPFHSIAMIRPGDPLDIPDRAIVFSNELFDAQPFRRLVFAGSGWREMGVKVDGDRLEPVLLDLQEPVRELPESAPEGYTVDWPAMAHSLLEDIVRQPWNGLFIAFDYGLDSTTLFRERPQGTGRTYSRHRMGSDLLERPGEVDLTCHIAWDMMEAILRSNGFTGMNLLRQEAFFMRFAQTEIQRILESGPAGFSAEKQSLMELVNPGNMGHAFHVLTGCRMEK